MARTSWRRSGSAEKRPIELNEMVAAPRSGASGRRWWRDRVGHPGFGKAGRAQDTAIAAAAWPPVAARIVTTVSQAVVEAELNAAPDDLRLRQGLQRRVDAKPLALDTAGRCQGGE